jgi:hypothetical protein
MIAAARRAIARAFATLVTVLTLGTVEVNRTGDATTSADDDDETEIALVDDEDAASAEKNGGHDA